VAVFFLFMDFSALNVVFFFIMEKVHLKILKRVCLGAHWERFDIVWKAAQMLDCKGLLLYYVAMAMADLFF
jgi:hypothetical protein